MAGDLAQQRSFPELPRVVFSRSLVHQAALLSQHVPRSHPSSAILPLRRLFLFTGFLHM
jgi:hypothetical protein